MAISFTQEQLQVIELHHCNILVSAAAGSGKTAVLVERIIRMICDEAHPVDIDRLLIVTFTNAAAAEMRERIAAGIAEQLEKHPESEHIQRQSTLLHNALITTIDSFSLFLIRNHFNEIGLDPAFRVADEGEIKLLRQDVLQELLEEKFEEGDDAFLHCVEYFCPGGKEKVLEEYILALADYAASFPWPEEWLLARKQDYAVDTTLGLSQSPYGEYLLTYLSRMITGCVDKLKEALALCQQPDGPYMYGELLDREIQQVEKLLNCHTLEEYGTQIPTVTFGRLPSKKDDSVSPGKRERAKSLRSQVKDTLQGLLGDYFTTPIPLALEQGRACMEPVGELMDLVVDFSRRMLAKKQEKKMVDFSDMEHYALNILLHKEEDGSVTPSEVAKEYRQHFHEILIDEYQDSNLVQEYLLKAVSGEDDGIFNRFMVGDVKQSIYKFRLARPEIFLEKYKAYNLQGGDRRRIDLAKNFRSRTQVIDGVNDIFSRIMSEKIGGIAYDEAAALYPGATYPENPDSTCEMLLVESPEKTDGISPKEAEALAIAGKIKNMLQTYQVTDKGSGKLRPARYRDMVILLRSNSGWDDVFKSVMEEQGIPVYITSKTGYFSAPEVQELLQLLRVLDNPRQDIPLFGVLKSIFGGFTEEEIAQIRSRDKAGSLYEALQHYVGEERVTAEDQEEDQEEETVDCREAVDCRKTVEKVSRFLEKLTSYRKLTTFMPIRELLQKLVEDFDYLNYVTALPGGSKRRANVEMLFTKASDFEHTSYFGLFHFIRYMEQLEKYDVDYGEADLLDENADVVRIMSIHKSKGLEFPITFVAGLSKHFNMQDVNKALIVDMDMGLATDYVDPRKRIRNKTLRRQVLSQKMKEDNLAEELRILYVAFTRAREKLILTGTLKQAAAKWEEVCENPEESLSYLDFLKATGYLDFLLPILPNTGIQTSVIELTELLGEQVSEQIEMMTGRELLQEADQYADEKALEGLRERFAYQYPYHNLAGLYTKTTVSELKIAAMAQRDEAAYHSFEEKEVVPYIPTFKREKEQVSGAVRGSAFHRVMELIDFERLLGKQFETLPDSYEAYVAGLDKKLLVSNLHEFLLEQVETLRLTQEYFQAVREEKIVRFFTSPLAFRMWKADCRGELYREQPFVYGISAQRLSESFPAEEKVLIQGIIDVFFVEDQKLILLDYKTDVISSMEDLRNRYSTQLDYYQEALEKIWNLPVAEKILYSFYLEKFE